MKRVRTAVCILALLVLLALLGHCGVHSVTSHALEGLSQARLYAQQGRFEEVLACVNDVTDDFERHEHLLEFFIKRETVASLSVNLHGLAAYASADNFSDFMNETDKALEQVRMLEHLFFSIF